MLSAVRTWILLSTLFVASGWILSAVHQLNGLGYGIIFALAIAIFLIQRSRHDRRAGIPAQRLHRWRRRFRRPAPLLFLAIATLVLLAGALYSPSNGSSTAYRIPRVMHWLAAGHWHWIRTLDVRINISGNGFEWLFAPLILLTHNDRLLFLVNWIPFLLLPGLTFSVFTRLGVRPRVAWWWMWLLPSGWCFIMQAGSTLNDAFGTSYALAAIDFGLRARQSRNLHDVWFGMLAAALAVGVKQTYILLALPGLLALLPSARLLLKRPFASIAVTTLCLLVSALPMILINLHYTGSWSGVSVESWGKAELHSPFWAIIGNIFCLGAQNLKPPVFPLVNSWNAAMQHFVQTPFGSHFNEFEWFGRLSFGAAESTSALGAGVCLLIIVSLLAATKYRLAGHALHGTQNRDRLLWLLRCLPWGLLLVFMAKVGTFENGRQLASYYILLFPALLMPAGHTVLVRQRWWQAMAIAVLLLAAALVVISRDRPLFPSQVIMSRLTSQHPDSKFISHVADTYTEAAAFEKERAVFRDELPADAAVIGYAAVSRETELLLWLPYGRRHVEVVLPGDTTEQLRQAGIRYVVVCQQKFLTKAKQTFPEWLDQHHGTLLNQWEFIEDPYEPAEHYFLVDLGTDPGNTPVTTGSTRSPSVSTPQK